MNIPAIYKIKYSSIVSMLYKHFSLPCFYFYFFIFYFLFFTSPEQLLTTRPDFVWYGDELVNSSAVCVSGKYGVSSAVCGSCMCGVFCVLSCSWWWSSVPCDEALHLWFVEVSLIGEVSSVDSTAGTAHRAQPGLPIGGRTPVTQQLLNTRTNWLTN